MEKIQSFSWSVRELGMLLECEEWAISWVWFKASTQFSSVLSSFCLSTGATQMIDRTSSLGNELSGYSQLW